MKAWYFRPMTREWVVIRGESKIGALLAKRLGYRVAFGKDLKFLASDSTNIRSLISQGR
jgi:hypothetical protein